MFIFFIIILSTFLVSLVSFIGVLTLLFKAELLERILLTLVAFSAGALIGGAFLHLLPEAIAETSFNEESIFVIFFFVLLGFCAFFILEQFINWHHHHVKEHPEIMPLSYLILISDGFHNFLDGLVIAGSFITSIPIGVVTTLALALHEIPQEIGDFGVLIYGGFGKKKALFFNFLSAATAIIGGITGYFLWAIIGKAILLLLPFAAGGFIYIASSDLIPEIKQKGSPQKSLSHFLVFLSGIGIMLLLKLYS